MTANIALVAQNRATNLTDSECEGVSGHWRAWHILKTHGEQVSYCWGAEIDFKSSRLNWVTIKISFAPRKSH